MRYHTEAVEAFIEGLGLSYQDDGLPRIAGRMLGLFIIHGGPFGLNEMAGALKVSRASVSTNARILKGLGFLELVGRPGDQRDYYQLAEDFPERLLDGYVTRIRHRLNLIHGLEMALPEADADASRRIRSIDAFYAAAIQATDDLVRRFRKVEGLKAS